MREALAIRQRELADDHLLTAVAASALADCLRRLGRYRDAETLVASSCPRILSDAAAPAASRSGR